MKLKIEKQPHGTIRVELTTDSTKKPLVIEVTLPQAQMITQMLEMAARADRFAFQLDL